MIRMINDWGWKIKDSKSINDFPQLDYLLMKLFCDLLFSMTTDLIFFCLQALQISCEQFCDFVCVICQLYVANLNLLPVNFFLFNSIFTEETDNN